VADFAINALPVQGWSLDMKGSEAVQIHGPLFASCISEAIACASVNGCLEAGRAHLTNACAATLQRHNAASGCIQQGFGLRVKPSLASNTGQGAQGAQGVGGGDWLPAQ